MPNNVKGTHPGTMFMLTCGIVVFIISSVQWRCTNPGIMARPVSGSPNTALSPEST
jgi:hypothetical protein